MTIQESVLAYYKNTLEARLIKLETRDEAILNDLKEIKANLRWAIGLIFSLNATIIGILTKGFGVF
jgi:hypothetical protein